MGILDTLKRSLSADTDDADEAPSPRSNSRDVADRLPPDARRRLFDLRQQRDDAFAAYRAAADRVQDLSEEKRDAERRLKHIQDPMYAGGDRSLLAPQALSSSSYSGKVPGKDLPAIRELTERIATITVDLVRLREVSEVRGARSNQSGALVRNVESFLKSLPEHSRIVTAPSVSARPAKGEDLTVAVERRRARLRELDADAHRAKSAPLPSADAKRLAREQLDKLAERGAVNVSPLIEGGGPFRFAEDYQNIVVEGAGGRAVGTHWGIDVEATLAWVFRDQFVAKIEAEIDAGSDDASALSTQQRAERIDEIARDRLLVEREEESLIGVAEQNGLAVMRRTDASPIAVLGIVIEEV